MFLVDDGGTEGSKDSQKRKRRQASSEELKAKADARKKNKTGLTSVSNNDRGAQAFRDFFGQLSSQTAGSSRWGWEYSTAHRCGGRGACGYSWRWEGSR